ncbi:MAG: twin-arginine translocase TatA/TatE family subunit [Anaerolineae bacterium]|nr:twin-arginine translocase TatA/TatE family subunit [Anaerolineae bacterium]
MYGLQPAHLLIIVIVAIIFFAPSRLPQLVRGFGRMFAEFREGVKEEPKLDKPKSETHSESNARS